MHFERTFCLSCFWKKHNMRAPTAYMAHFAAVPCCGEYSLEKVLTGCDSRLWLTTLSCDLKAHRTCGRVAALPDGCRQCGEEYLLS